MLIIVGFAGSKGAGKDTAAQTLIDTGWHHDSFAAPIRTAACALLGISPAELQATKENPRHELGGKSLRDFMQLMGTEFGREMMYEHMWVSSFITRTKKYQRVVVTDVRFDNEAETIKGLGGFIIRIERPLVMNNDLHISERPLPAQYIDGVIVNNGSIPELHNNVYKVLRKLLHPTHKES